MKFLIYNKTVKVNATVHDGVHNVLKVADISFLYGWTVIRLGHPDSASFPLTSEIRLRPDCMWRGGSDFHELQYPVLH